MDVNKCDWPVIDLKNLGLSPVINCSSSRVGNWVSVCNVQRCLFEPQRDMSLEDEVEECFTILQGESVSQTTCLSHLSFRTSWTISAQHFRLYQYQSIHLLYRLIFSHQRHLRKILWSESTLAHLRCCRSSSSYTDQTRLYRLH